MIERLTAVWFHLIRWGFHLLYHQLAWSYDMVSWLVSLGHWRNWQLAGLSFVQGERVLELGHGTGHMLAQMEARGWQAVGLDLSPQMGRLARARTAVPLLNASATQLPFADGLFDTVFATFPTNYIVQPETVAEVARVLGKNGRLVIVPSANLTSDGWLYRLIAWAFWVTGQQTEADNEQVWDSWGGAFAPYFDLTSHLISLDGSEVMVLVAECPS